jgi:hypothetical protein
VFSGNTTIHNALISLNADGSLLIPPSTAVQQSAPAIMTAGQTPHILTTPSSPQSFYSLHGPSGKGIYQLQTSSSITVRGFGLKILSNDWYVQEAGHMFLRHKGLDSGFWIAVPEKCEGVAGWEIWWLRPSGATVEDFKDYVMIDIQVVKVEKTGRDREL